MTKTKQVNWAGQLCVVLEETPDRIRIRFTNATGTGELWLSRSANLHIVPNPLCGGDTPIHPGSRYDTR